MKKLIFTLFLLAFCTIKGIAQCADVIVSQDGNGDFTSIQEAIESVPANNDIQFIIYIKNGVYDEKLYFENNYITLIGENRDSTIVTTAELRRVWRETHTSDWGAATVNIDNSATDLTFANMTIRNNFADVYPDFPDNNDHTFAIRGGGHRIIILNCNVITTGGDTLSLWNTDGGMFYHNNCYFEGYVDYVAPRGYCYITDSDFYGYNDHASIWHDGTGGEDHKFVIRRSVFDGVPGFALGRHHKDAAFYLLDCFFTDNMQTSQGINWTGSDALSWGHRYYYYNCHRSLIDFPWMYDNLEEATGSPEADEIDAFWTFNGEWDPESQLDGLLPFAFLPYPRNGEGCSGITPTLSWTTGNCALSYDIYLGDSPDTVEFIGNVEANAFSPENLEEATQYFWKIDAISSTDTVQGQVWSFNTGSINGFPDQAFNPVPGDGENYITNITKLDWDYLSCSTDSFYIYFGSQPDQLALAAIQKYPAYFSFSAQDDSTYFWRVDSKNDLGITEGQVWSFTLNPTVNAIDENPDQDKNYFETVFPNPFTSKTHLSYSIPDKGIVEINLVDTNGQIVQNLLQKSQPAGKYNLTIIPKNTLPKGVYFCQIYHKSQLADTIKVVIQ